MQAQNRLSSRLARGVSDRLARGLALLADVRRLDLPGPVIPEVAVDPMRLNSFRREVFPASGPIPWLDRPDASTHIEIELSAGRMSIATANLARSWIRDGFIILPKFFSKSRIGAVWAAYERAIAAGTFGPQPEKISDEDALPGRMLDPHLKLPAINDLLCDPDMLAVVGMLLGARPAPFQTIMGHKGSQQLAHSDTMHMTTYPMGYLVANWIAFEDIHPNSGPLVYYPGSHRLPYITSRDLDIPVSGETGGKTDYSAYKALYEPAISRAIAEHDLKPAYFTPQAGDVLLWHANLLHGGSKRNEIELSRKALVCHYFADGCLTYHDYTATPTRQLLARMARRKRLRYAVTDIALAVLERSLRSTR